MKKRYICPTIETEYIEDEDLMISTSHTKTLSYVDDPSNEGSDTPGLWGDGDAPIVIGGDDEGDY